MPAGVIGGRIGVTTSAADSLQIKLFGRGAQGSMPEASIDPVVMAASIVLRLQGLVSREVPPTEAAVLTIGVLQAGAALLGMLTVIGGGMVRDILITEVSVVLRADLYAVAALAGAAIVVIGHILHLSTALTSSVGALLCFGLRFMAIHFGWRLPVAAAQ